MNVTSSVGAEFWKWVAITLASIIVAATVPSIGWFVDTRNEVSKGEVAVIRDRQDEVRTKLALLEQQVASLIEQVERLASLVQVHIQTDLPPRP